MDNTGFTICIGLVAATATATATTAYAFAITLREYRAELGRLRNTVGAMLEEAASTRDRIRRLERTVNDLHSAAWPTEPLPHADIDADEVLRKLKAHAQPAPNVGKR